MTAAIRTQALTRRFGGLTAVDQVDLTVPTGCVFGFLGRNGAGKTTLIRLLLGLIGPTSGHAELLGQEVRPGGGRGGPWDRIGYLVDGPGLYPELTVADHLGLVGRYRRCSPAAVTDVVERLALGQYLTVRARALSLGNRARLGLALALVHDPELLVLDEPTNGMDPAGVVEIRDLLRGLVRRGATVFMSTHIVSELEVLADEVGIIHDGRLIEHRDAAGLAALGRRRLKVGLTSGADAAVAAWVLERHGWPASVPGPELTIQAPSALEHPEQVATILVGAGTPPCRLDVVRDSLEAHFLAITGGGS